MVRSSYSICAEFAMATKILILLKNMDDVYLLSTIICKSASPQIMCILCWNICLNQRLILPVQWLAHANSRKERHSWNLSLRNHPDSRYCSVLEWKNWYYWFVNAKGNLTGLPPKPNVSLPPGLLSLHRLHLLSHLDQVSLSQPARTSHLQISVSHHLTIANIPYHPFRRHLNRSSLHQCAP